MEFFRNILRNRSSQTKPQPSKTMNTVDSSKNAHPEKDITMKRIQTLRPVRLLRFIYALVACTLIDATVGAGAAIAGDENSKVTLVYERDLPNVPGKSIKAVLVEYGPGGTSSAHTHPKSAFICATVLEGAIRSSVNNGRPLLIAPDRASPRCLVTDTVLAKTQARPNPRNCWPCSWSIRTKRNC